MKSNIDEFPLGYLPVLKLDSGKVYSQSRAIMRYACKHGGDAGPMYPSEAEAALAVDEAMDMADELLTKCPQDPDETKKKELREIYSREKMPKYFVYWAKRLAEGGGPFYLGTQLTLADLAVAPITKMILDSFFDYVAPSFLDPWPTLLAHAKAVSEHPLVVKNQ